MSDADRGDGEKPEFILPGDDPELDALAEKLQPKGAAGEPPHAGARRGEAQAAAAKPAATVVAETAKRRTRALFVAFGVLAVTAPLVVLLSGRTKGPDVKAEATAAASASARAVPVRAGATVVPPVTPAATASASAASSADAAPSAAAPRPARPPKKPRAADAGAAEPFPPDMFQ